jgi:Phosphotransferase enzyme family
MLSAVTEAIKEAGLLDANETVKSDLAFKGNIVYLNMHGSDGTYLHVRVSSCQNLEGEYFANLDAARRYPRLAPFPLGHGIAGGAWWIAYEGVHLRRITSDKLMRAKPKSLIHRGIISYFQESRLQAATATLTLSEIETLSRSQVIGCTIPDSFVRKAALLYESLGMESVPATLQHCDLAINNLALADSKLVIFDWEDFGKATLPGLDLAVLLASALDFDPPALRAVMRQPLHTSEKLVAWLAPVCEIVGIRTSTFLQALPLYMLTFLQLKSPPYSQNVRDRVCAATLGLA